MITSAGSSGNIYNYVFSDVSGQVFLGNFKDVVAQLDSRGFKELAEILERGQGALIVKDDLDEEEKQELIEVLERIGIEAMKAKPNRSILKGFSESLKSVSSIIPEVIKAVNDIIKT